MVVWTNLRKATVVAMGMGAGLAIYYYQRMSDAQMLVHNSLTICDEPHNPRVLWNCNWDRRDPKSLVKPIKTDTPEEQNRYNNELQNVRPKAMRHIILIRHGEYLDDGPEDNHKLTDRGRLQAKFTGKRLRDLGIKWDEIITSTMVRAEETADIIIKQLDLDPKEIKHCSLLCEGAPIPPQPPVGRWKPDTCFFQDGARIEAAFRNYFHRASADQKHDSYTMIVGHANVMRYFICRALQFPPEAWLRITLNHASITWLVINPDGCVSIKYMGDSGYMPPSYLTNRIPRQNRKK